MTNTKMSVEEIRDVLEWKSEKSDTVLIRDLADTALALAEGRDAWKQTSDMWERTVHELIIEKKSVQADLSTLRAENERLKEDIRKATETVQANYAILHIEKEQVEQMLELANLDGKRLAATNEEFKAENERLRKLDGPVFDATDAAHPAWWRGEKYGSQQAARKVRKILDGGDDGVGVSSDPDLEKIRRDILALKAENERLKKLTTMAEPQAKHHPGDPPWPTRHRKVWVLVYDYDRLKAENSRLSRYERAWNKIKAWAIYDERLLHKIENGCGIKEGK